MNISKKIAFMLADEDTNTFNAQLIRTLVGSSSSDICGDIISTQCKGICTIPLEINVGDIILNADESPFNGDNKYWLFVNQLWAIDEPIRNCLVSTMGIVISATDCPI